MADNSRLDSLMMLMALKTMESDLKGKSITPFTVSIEVSATSVSCHTRGNRKLIEDVDGLEWFKETQERIEPIMSEQTTKFAELLQKKFGLSFAKEPKTDGPSFEDLLKQLFSGGTEG
ncbi:MAG: hypothetical protein HDR24_13615 [Lachnospiraceae bacterium]|nr:hypothetical protein [Lachnospiraceae bacterium]